MKQLAAIDLVFGYSNEQMMQLAKAMVAQYAAGMSSQCECGEWCDEDQSFHKVNTYVNNHLTGELVDFVRDMMQDSTDYLCEEILKLQPKIKSVEFFQESDEPNQVKSFDIVV